MNSSAEDSPEVLEASNGSLPLFVLLWIACLSFTWFVLRCLYYCNRRRTREVAVLLVAGQPLNTITEVERRKTLIHHFQINQVTIEVKAENLKSEHTKCEDSDGDSNDATLVVNPSNHEGSLDEDLEMGTNSHPGDQNEAGETSSEPPAPPVEIDEEEEDSGVLDLPRKHYPRAVPNVCAICLDTYKPNETVVWSSNIDCSHAFHQDCILDYLVKLVKVKDTAVPCPCCRQDFMGLSSEADEKGATNDTGELDVIVVGDTTRTASENM